LEIAGNIAVYSDGWSLGESQPLFGLVLSESIRREEELGFYRFRKVGLSIVGLNSRKTLLWRVSAQDLWRGSCHYLGGFAGLLDLSSRLIPKEWLVSEPIL
jgi:hypothetical protein